MQLSTVPVDFRQEAIRLLSAKTSRYSDLWPNRFHLNERIVRLCKNKIKYYATLILISYWIYYNAYSTIYNRETTVIFKHKGCRFNPKFVSDPEIEHLQRPDLGSGNNSSL